MCTCPGPITECIIITITIPLLYHTSYLHRVYSMFSQDDSQSKQRLKLTDSVRNIGPYKVIGNLGKGAFGTVYKALNTTNGTIPRMLYHICYNMVNT